MPLTRATLHYTVIPKKYHTSIISSVIFRSNDFSFPHVWDTRLATSLVTGGKLSSLSLRTTTV